MPLWGNMNPKYEIIFLSFEYLFLNSLIESFEADEDGIFDVTGICIIFFFFISGL